MNEKLRSKFIQICFTVVFFITPLLFLTSTHDQFELPKLVFLSTLTLPLLLLGLTTPKRALSGPLSLTLILFLLSQAVSCLPNISVSWQTSLWGDYENFSGFYTLLTYFAWYLLFIQFLNIVLIRQIFFFIILTAFLSSLYAIGQHFQFDFAVWSPDSVNSTREFAALGNPNFLSAYIAMAFPLFLDFAFEKRSSKGSTRPFFSVLFIFLLVVGTCLLFLGTARGQNILGLQPSDTFNFVTRILGLLFLCSFCFHAARPRSMGFRWIVGLILLGGLFSTASRGGFLAAVSGIGLWAILTCRDTETKERWKTYWKTAPKLPVIASLLAVGLFVILFGWNFLQRLGGSILNIPQSLAASRSYIWKPAWDIFLSHPWFGIGLDTFKIAFPRYSGIQFNQMDGLFTSSRMAHNEWLQIAATTGLIGSTAYFLLLGVLIVAIFRSFKIASSETKGAWIVVASCALAYQVQNFFSFGVAALNLVWFFILSVVVVLKNGTDIPSEKKHSTYGMNGLYLFLILAMLLFPMRRLAADIAFSKADMYSNALNGRTSQSSGQVLDRYSQAQVDYMERAQGLFPGDVKYTLYTGLAHEQRARFEPQNMAESMDSALRNYQKAILISPDNAYYYSDEGRVFTTLARQDPTYWPRAEKAYEQAVIHSPSSPYFLLSWVITLEKNRKLEEAKTQTQKAFAIDPTFSAKILAQIAFTEYKQGDQTDAYRHIEEAIAGNPSNPEAYYCRGLFYLQEQEKKKALADFEKVRDLHPDDFHNPSIQNLDQLIQACGSKG